MFSEQNYISNHKICAKFAKSPCKALTSLFVHRFLKCIFQNSLYIFVLVDEKEKKFGLNPEKELADNGFHEYQRL